MLNLFRRFFSFSDLVFAGDGAAFFDFYYIVIRKLAVLCVLACVALMVAAVLLVPKKNKAFFRRDLLVSAVSVCAALACILGIRYTQFSKTDTVIWNAGTDPASIYENFTDTKASLLLTGLYQYTFRDFCLSFGLFQDTDENADAILDEYYSGMDKHEDNSMTGLLSGKNLILVQLESIDTWMLTEEYMPALYSIKQDSVSFGRHFTPAYIAAGTFNTELMVNTGLLPAGNGISTSVYARNEFPYSLANLFSSAGYTARSFHGSEGDVYNRESIHSNWGYEDYYSGIDMGMENYMLDSQMINAYDEMTEGSPFFTFIITFSGHGPYTMDSPSAVHYEDAKQIAQRSEENYIHAVAHAMETDLFIDELFSRLEDDGLLQDTVLIFYADHYNYYMLDDPLNMEIKGAADLNLLQQTDFFIWSSDIEAFSVDKVTSSIDVLPTIANLFDLDTDYRYYSGKDAFSEEGGYVFFNDSSWYDGSIYRTASTEPTSYTLRIDEEIAQRREMNRLVLKNNYFEYLLRLQE